MANFEFREQHIHEQSLNLAMNIFIILRPTIKITINPKFNIFIRIYYSYQDFFPL